MSDLIRLGVQYQLSVAYRRCVDIARSEGASARQRLKAMEFLEQARMADIANTLPLETMERIRAEAREEARLNRRAAKAKPDPVPERPDDPGVGSRQKPESVVTFPEGGIA